jgi:nucleoside-diphosphate-sugar epimerase
MVGSALVRRLARENCSVLKVTRSELDLTRQAVGTGEEISIADLARRVAVVVGFDGELYLDAAKPDGAPRKLLDSSRLRALGWKPRIGLDAGLRSAYL